MSEILLDDAQVSLFRKIRAVIEQRGVRAKGRLTLKDMTPAEASALAELLALRETPKGTTNVRLERLDEILRSSRLQRGLLDTLVALDGPLSDKRAARAETRAERARLWDSITAKPEIVRRPELRQWAERIQRGTLRRVAPDEDPAALVDLTLSIVDRLPSAGIRLQVLASDATGDPHALDVGMPLATLVQSALASLAQRALPTSAGERRALWEWAGVSVDALSSDVLVLGLAPLGPGLVSDALRSHAEAMEPIRLTLRQLKREPLGLRGISRAYICENPAVLEQVADDLASLPFPLVCTEGMVSGAAGSLLGGLTTSGVELRFHGDFDWGGIRVGNVLVQRFGARPWQFSAEDYERALATVPRRSELVGTRTDARWDPDLALALDRARIAVYEEQLIPRLVEDLREG